VEEDVRRVSVENRIEQLAWVVLRAADRMQSRGSTARLVVPRAPEVAEEMGMELTDAQLLSVGEYLVDHGYITPADLSLTWGAYTITPAGLKWLERDLSDEEGASKSALQAEVEEERRRLEEVERELDEEPPGAPERVAEGQERAEPRSWWRRMFGG
jgi:DNA-binding PadR family transcriptional regulator